MSLWCVFFHYNVIQCLQFTLLHWNLNTSVLHFKRNNVICQKKIKGVGEMILSPDGTQEKQYTCWSVTINKCFLDPHSNTNLFFKILLCFEKWNCLQLWNSQREFPPRYFEGINLCLLFPADANLPGDLVSWLACAHSTQRPLHLGMTRLREPVLITHSDSFGRLCL